MLARLTKSHTLRTILRTQQRPMGAFVNHRDTEDNVEETPFEFTEENYAKIYEKLTHFPDNLSIVLAFQCSSSLKSRTTIS